MKSIANFWKYPILQAVAAAVAVMPGCIVLTVVTR